MICDDCTNNKDGKCIAVIEMDGTIKIISPRQTGCGIKNKTTLIDHSTKEKSIMEMRVELLELKVKELVQRGTLTYPDGDKQEQDDLGTAVTIA